MRGTRVSRFRLIAVVVGLVVVAVSAAASAAAPAPTAYTAAQWKQVIAKAKQEGSVTIYSSQLPSHLAELATAFKAKYGIDVTVNRQTDGVLVTQVNAEKSTGKLNVDLWVQNSKPYVFGALKNAWATDARGPNFFTKAFDRTKYAKPGKAFQPGAAILGFAWNTNVYPKGLTRFQDLLNADLKGRVGILQPTSPAGYDYYLWMKATYGADFPTKLAPQKGKIFISGAPMLQSLTAGEIAASAFVPATAIDLSLQGAPISFKPFGWNTPFFAIVMKGSPHPNAAQLLADFMVSRQGQAVINKRYNAILPKIPNAFNNPFRVTKLNDFTPQKIASYKAEWESIFLR